MSFSYSDMDQLILQRWPDVVGLIEAHRSVQDRVEEMIEIVGERVARWARPMGFETEAYPKDAEICAWRPGWSDKRRGQKVVFTVGGFCPFGFRKTDAKHPYLWVYVDGLSNFRMKEPDLVEFSQSLRAALGERRRLWEADDIDDTDGPLGHYLTSVSDADRTKLISSPDALFAFVTDQFPRLFELADLVDAELAKLVR